MQLVTNEFSTQNVRADFKSLPADLAVLYYSTLSNYGVEDIFQKNV